MNTSVLKTIGVNRVYSGANLAQSIDGSVSYGDAFAFDFDQTDGITTGSFDFVGIAIHAIGHALGFRSGVDVYGGNTNFGDGRQASHWKDAPSGNPQVGIMEPTFERQQQGIITWLDLAAFDAMGWNIAYDVLYSNREFSTLNPTFGAVPEPAGWALLIAGFCMMGGALRRCRAVAA